MSSSQASSRERLSWDDYFLGVVDALAQRATCDRGRSAAVFTRDNDILASGYVGAPPGFPHCDDVGHLMLEYDGRAHCIRTLHAEQNAIIRAARTGVSLINSTVYCTMEPCRNCALSLVALGVRRVVAKNPYHAVDRQLLLLANIEVVVLREDLLYE